MICLSYLKGRRQSHRLGIWLFQKSYRFAPSTLLKVLVPEAYSQEWQHAIKGWNHPLNEWGVGINFIVSRCFTCSVKSYNYCLVLGEYSHWDTFLWLGHRSHTVQFYWSVHMCHSTARCQNETRSASLNDDLWLGAGTWVDKCT